MPNRKFFFSKVGKTNIVPIRIKILLIFLCIILLSNFTTNLISSHLSQKQIIDLSNTIMVSQLKELYTNSTNQYQIYQYTNKKSDVVASLNRIVSEGFTNKNSLALAVYPDGTLDFVSCNDQSLVWTKFLDKDALSLILENQKNNIEEGSINFKTLHGDFFGVYKYQADWGYFLIRAENRSDLSENSRKIYLYTAAIILILTSVFIIIGFIVLKKEFRTVDYITKELYEMQRNKKLGIIDLSKATNDDITYLAASFNSLSSSVNNLLGTFQKFVSKDVVQKAYSDQGINLEGMQLELTMLFSDIKSFTYRTETLGNDIIDVLNVHYNRVIHCVHENRGVVGSIIGDAILAVYGTLDSDKSKSFNSLQAAWDITRETASLRQIMSQRRIEIEKKRSLSESEERIFHAVSIEVGVGIDGGNVFYGNIGSNEHMANTVIGDNVNSASRLEGLTRIYHLPVIVSEYIKNEVEKETNQYRFFEIDTVQVKGKTEGKKIYFPLDLQTSSEDLLAKYELFEKGLNYYYEGDWSMARKTFKDLDLDVKKVFVERMGHSSAPADWSGIWTMTSK